MTKAAIEASLAALDTWIQVFAVLVAIGIVGEVGFGVRHWVLSRRLHVIQHAEDLNHEQIIAGLNREAGQARKDAASAIERAAKAEEHLGWARNEAASANERAALAEQHAAEANLTAEQERLARIKIEDTLSGWRLDAQAQNRVTERLKPYAGTPFDFAANPTEYRFLETLDQVLKTAHWSMQLPKATNPLFNVLLDNKATIFYGSGITVEFAQERSQDFTPAAEALVKSLIAEGIPAKGHLITQGADPNPSAIHVVIGKRE
jgi:hypothetical protein